MDFNLGFALAFKCIFCYDFTSIFFIGTQYMIHDGKKNELKKIINNYGLLNDQIWAIFSKVSIFVILSWIGIFFPLTCIIYFFENGHPFI
jgi:hypothetical protein